MSQPLLDAIVLLLIESKLLPRVNYRLVEICSFQPPSLASADAASQIAGLGSGLGSKFHLLTTASTRAWKNRAFNTAERDVLLSYCAAVYNLQSK
jgi:hypothetical protein